MRGAQTGMEALVAAPLLQLAQQTKIKKGPLVFFFARKSTLKSSQKKKHDENEAEPPKKKTKTK